MGLAAHQSTSRRFFYETYRPIEENNVPFEELQKRNPEIFGWLTVKDIHIDYPLVQAENNFLKSICKVLYIMKIHGMI